MSPVSCIILHRSSFGPVGSCAYARIPVKNIYGTYLLYVYSRLISLWLRYFSRSWAPCNIYNFDEFQYNMYILYIFFRTTILILVQGHPRACAGGKCTRKLCFDRVRASLHFNSIIASRYHILIRHGTGGRRCIF